jgi:hypothetical protein
MLERVVWFAGALVVLVLAFFFLAVAAVAGAVLAAVLFVRIWWIGRKVGKAGRDQVITAEYTVVEREPQPQARLERHSREGGSPGKDVPDSGFPPPRE